MFNVGVNLFPLLLLLLLLTLLELLLRDRPLLTTPSDDSQSSLF